jgi:bacterioferritin (cytochrome b1)
MNNWLTYFQRNRRDRLQIPWHLGIEIEERLRRPLIHSLQRFQIGESGEGRHLRANAAERGDAEYAEAIDLFIREEQEHARLMAAILRRLRAPLLEKHWSDGCFMYLRHVAGLKEQLLVLLLPEMIAKRHFRALHDGTHDPVLRAVFAQICHDEEGHLNFHIDTLQELFAKWSWPRRAAVRAIWRILFRASCVVVMWDHRSALKAAGVSASVFWWDCGLIFDEVAARIFSTAPKPIRLDQLVMEASPAS